MKNIIIMTMILTYFFIVSATLTAMANDPLIDELNAIYDNTTYTIDRTATNITAGATTTVGTISYLSMVLRMFTFRIPSSIFPSFLGGLISFINWIMIIVLGVVVYKSALPTVDG